MIGSYNCNVRKSSFRCYPVTLVSLIIRVALSMSSFRSRNNVVRWKDQSHWMSWRRDTIRRMLSESINQLTLVYANETSRKALTSNSLSLSKSNLRIFLPMFDEALRYRQASLRLCSECEKSTSVKSSLSIGDHQLACFTYLCLPFFWRSSTCEKREDGGTGGKEEKDRFRRRSNWFVLSGCRIFVFSPPSSTPYVGEIQFPSYKQRDIRSDYSKESDVCVCRW